MEPIFFWSSQWNNKIIVKVTEQVLLFDILLSRYDKLHPFGSREKNIRYNKNKTVLSFDIIEPIQMLAYKF